jgi:hypothetical protein
MAVGFGLTLPRVINRIFAVLPILLFLLGAPLLPGLAAQLAPDTAWKRRSFSVALERSARSDFERRLIQVAEGIEPDLEEIRRVSRERYVDQPSWLSLIDSLELTWMS